VDNNEKSSVVDSVCPECLEAGMLEDPDLGELYCPSCGCTIRNEAGLSNDGVIHGGSPSFPFLYDKGLPTSFRPSDVKDERALEFKRLARVDEAAKGIRPKESSVLNVCRKILPMLECRFPSSRGVVDKVKSKVTELVLKNDIPHVRGIYPALVAYALLDLKLYVDRKKVLQMLTNSHPGCFRKIPFTFASNQWTCSFQVDKKDPVDLWIIDARAKSKEDESVRGNAAAMISVTSCYANPSLEGVKAVSRAVDGRLRVQLQVNKAVFTREEIVSLSASVLSDGGAPLTDRDVELTAYLFGGGRFKAASRALWDLCKFTGLPLPKATAEDYLRTCDLEGLRNNPTRLKRALETLADCEHIARLYGRQVQPRQLAAVVASKCLPHYGDGEIAEEFGIGVSALAAKREHLRILMSNLDELFLVA